MPAMAYSEGGTLAISDDTPKTLPEALLRTAAASDKGVIHVQPDRGPVFQSYAALLDDAQCMLTCLQEAGFTRGDRAILQIAALNDFFPAFWACLLGGITPVTVAVAPRYDQENAVVLKLLNVWKVLGAPTVIASEALIAPLANIAGLPQGGKLKLMSIDALRAHGQAPRLPRIDPNDAAFFQLSSGSTGAPKCIPETHRTVIAHIYASSQFNGYDADDVTLNWLPMDHVVPLLTFHIKDVYLGCQQIQAPTASVLADPLLWLDLVEEYRVTHTWSPNFGYKLVADALARADARRKRDLSSLKFMMNAGEQVTLPVVRAFLDALERNGVSSRVMQPAFGMAEVATCMTYQNDFDLKAGGVHRFSKSSLGGNLTKASADDHNASDFIDLGPPIAGVRIRIVDKNGNLQPEAVIGRLQIKGEVLMPGYLNNPAANSEAFVGDGWFNTGDLGFIIDGRMTITGREKEMIILYGANYYSHEIEDVVNRTEGVEPTYSAACGISDARSGSEELAIFFACRYDDVTAQLKVIRAIRGNVSRAIGVTPHYVVPMAKSSFPKTTSGKIQRTQLKARLAGGDFASVLQAIERHETSHVAPETDLERWLTDLWGKVLDVARVGLHDDFLALGGDSLRALQIWGQLRDAFPVELPLQRILIECSTVAKLAAVIEEILIDKLQTLSEREAELLMQAVPASRQAATQASPEALPGL